MLSYLFWSTPLTPEQRIEALTKECDALRAQAKVISDQLETKESEIEKLKAPTKKVSLASIISRVDVFSHVNVLSELNGLHPDMTEEERAEMLKKLRTERNFRFTLLPPVEEVSTGVAAVMNEIRSKVKVQ